MRTPEATALSDASLRPSGPPRPALAPIVELTGVTKRWRRSTEAVLDSIDLSFPPHSATWIGGENGAGKTTLLRIIAGLIAADQGQIRVLGLDVERDRRAYQRKIGFLSAGNSGLFARLTVRRHFDYWARLAFIPRERRDRAVETALDRFELRTLADRRLDRMSMGQRQRVRIAMTFLHDPDVVLLDEARTSLDGRGAELLLGACGELIERGGAMLACTPSDDHRDVEIFDRRFELHGGVLEELR